MVQRSAFALSSLVCPAFNDDLRDNSTRRGRSDRATGHFWKDSALAHATPGRVDLLPLLLLDDAAWTGHGIGDLRADCAGHGLDCQ